MDGFKKFILRGNVVDLAVGVIIGVAFGAVVTAFVNGVANPIIGLPGKANFDRLGVCLKDPCVLDEKTGITSGHFLNYGVFVTALINFLIVAAVVYFIVVRPLQKLMDRMNPVKAEEPAAATKECPECLSNIPAAAVRCAYCTVEQLEPA